MRNSFKNSLSLLPVLVAAGGLVPVVTTPVLGGSWVLAETSEEGPVSGKRCSAGLEATVQGSSWKLLAGGPTEVGVSMYVTSVPSPYWTDHRIHLPPMPARLQPGQTIQWPLSIEIRSGYRYTSSSAWIYRQAGVGGGDDVLLHIDAQGEQGAQGTSRAHVVPAGPAGRDARLNYLVGGGFTGGFSCGFRYHYAWSEEGGGATSPQSSDGRAPSSPGADGVIHGTDPRGPSSGPANGSIGEGTSKPGIGAAPNGGVIDGGGPLVNLALGRPATQSSVYGGTGVDQGPAHGNDGVTSGRDPHDLVLTNPEPTPWWMVDLGGRATIETVRIFNRLNPDVLANPTLEVMIGDDGHGWRRVYRHDGTRWETLSVPVGAAARFVRVQLGEQGGLQFFEVEVWGRR